MKQVVFFGNGLNRVGSRKYSWSDMLKGIDGNVSCKDTPFTMWYENIVFQSSDYERKIKEKVARTVEKFRTNELYDKMVNLPVEDFITTNYDYAFDNALKANGYVFCKSESYGKEKRYNLYRCRVYKNQKGSVKRIWPIHGDCNHPRTLMLGYEQYGGQLREISSWVKSHYKIVSNVDGKKLTWELSPHSDKSSWLRLFFCSNVHFVGFGFSFDEMDIWWLLFKRRKIMLQHKEIDIQNELFFYCKKKNPQSTEERISENLGVRLKPYDVEGKNEYMKLYDDALLDLGRL